jgi:hypothetical protein
VSLALFDSLLSFSLQAVLNLMFDAAPNKTRGAPVNTPESNAPRQTPQVLATTVVIFFTAMPLFILAKLGRAAERTFPVAARRGQACTILSRQESRDKFSIKEAHEKAGEGSKAVWVMRSRTIARFLSWTIRAISAS